MNGIIKKKSLLMVCNQEMILITNMNLIMEDAFIATKPEKRYVKGGDVKVEQPKINQPNPIAGFFHG